MFAQYPRVSAWLLSLGLTLSLLLSGTGALLMTRGHAPRMPETVYALHGYITSVRENDVFALQIETRAGAQTIWLRAAVGASLSWAHLARHYKEHAATDVLCAAVAPGVLVAWSAD